MSSPTPYPDVNAILNVLLAAVRAILGNQFVGFYLYGSLASGDFDSHPHTLLCGCRADADQKTQYNPG
jgi:hypothetical protein